MEDFKQYLVTEFIEKSASPSLGATLSGYFVRPDDARRLPGIEAIHENRGLVEHIKDCARRLTSAGYVVLAPDLLSRQGGTGRFADPNDAIAALGQSTLSKTRAIWSRPWTGSPASRALTAPAWG